MYVNAVNYDGSGSGLTLGSCRGTPTNRLDAFMPSDALTGDTHQDLRPKLEDLEQQLGWDWARTRHRQADRRNARRTHLGRIDARQGLDVPDADSHARGKSERRGMTRRTLVVEDQEDLLCRRATHCSAERMGSARPGTAKQLALAGLRGMRHSAWDHRSIDRGTN
jgi:hypothetical protein